MQKKIVITVKGKDLKNLNKLADQLQSEEEVELSNVFDFGVITGSVEEAKIDRLKKLKAIESVELDTPVSIVPPDSEVQ